MQQPQETGARRRHQGRRWLTSLAGITLISALGIGAIAAGACGGGDAEEGTPTSSASRTPRPSPTPGENAGEKTPIAFSEGDFLTAADLAARGVGEPGRGEFNATRLVIPAIGVDAQFTVKAVGTDGQMPNPNGPEDVAYYDFAQWPGLGGLPDKGGNIVMAGHVDYINYGPAVFWRLDELKPGDEVQIYLVDGTVATYKIEFSKVVDPSSATDWSGLVSATADESVTLITCTGEFSAGHYSNRQIIWGRRVV